MRLLLAVSTLLAVIGCWCMAGSVRDRPSDLDREHNVLMTSIQLYLQPPTTAPVDALLQPAWGFATAGETETRTLPRGVLPTSVALFIRSPEVLRNLARLAMILIQFWRASAQKMASQVQLLNFCIGTTLLQEPTLRLDRHPPILPVPRFDMFVVSSA